MVDLKYVIPLIPPSNNQFKGRKNVHEYRELKKEWEQFVWAYCRPVPSSPPQEKVVVTITYFFKIRGRHDPDNYNGVFLLDGLVKCGILKDDSFDCIKLELEGGYNPKNPHTEIRIQSMKEGG